MKAKLFLYSAFFALLTFCNNSKKNDSLNDLNLNGSPKEIEEKIYKAVDKNGTISKGNFFRPLMNVGLMGQSFLNEINNAYNLNIICAIVKLELNENRVNKIFAINNDYEDLYELKYENNKLKEIKKTENYKSNNLQLYPKNTSLIKYNYDDRNRLIEVAEYDKNGDNQRKVIYEYANNSEKIISKTIFEEQIVKEARTYEHENGFVTESYKDDTFHFSNKIQLNENEKAISEEDISDKNGFLTLFYYDKFQNLIKQEQLNKLTKQKTIFEYKYKYDEKNNWTQKISIVNKKPEFIIERKIIY